MDARLLRAESGSCVLDDELLRLGFEAVIEGNGCFRLRNCPYHDMARENSEFVCSMNFALMQGVVEGINLADVLPALEPRD